MTLYESFIGDYVFAPIPSPVLYKGKPVGILLDNGHGTREYLPNSKRNCDGSIFEGEWSREMVARMIPGLRANGFDARCLVPEDKDINIHTRAKRANTIMKNEPDIAWFYLAVHLNAEHGGERAWKPDSSGYIAYAAEKASDFSCLWAKTQVAMAREWGLGGNRSIPAEGFKRANFVVIHETKMPAILTESLFMTNPTEAKFLTSEKGKQTIDNLHAAVLCKMFGVPYAVKIG